MQQAVIFLGLMAATIWGGWWADRLDFPSLLMGYSLFFGCYLLAIRSVLQSDKPVSVWIIVLAGIVLRSMLLGSPPQLSDDSYRFLWDGNLALHGIHPFAHTPRYVLEHFSVPGNDVALFQLLNSPDYHTVYPPVGQAVFRCAAWCAGGNVFWGVMGLRVALLAGEIMTMWALVRYLRRAHPAYVRVGTALYALNPLVILETVGNCHFEGLMVGFLVLGLLALDQDKRGLAGVWWALSVAAKLLPVLFLPAVLGWLGWRRTLRFGVFFAGTTLLLFAPLFEKEVLANMAGSVGLYFDKFEFNASFYYLLSYYSPTVTGWYQGRLVSPGLALATILIASALAWELYQHKARSIADLQYTLLVTVMVYLLNATTIHAWYVVVPFLLSIGMRSLVPLAWTWAVFFSYSHYHKDAYQENFWWIAAEYGVLVVMGFKNWKSKRITTNE